MKTTSIPPCQLHVSARTLSDYHDGALNAGEMERLRAHVGSCAACQRRLQSYDWLAREARALPLPADLGASIRHPQTLTAGHGRPRAQMRLTQAGRRRLATPAYLGPLAATLLVALVAGAIFTALRLGVGRPVVSGALTTFYLA